MDYKKIKLIENMKSWANSGYVFDDDDVKEIKKFDTHLASLLKDQIDGFYKIKDYVKSRIE